MRSLLLALTLGVAGSALLPAADALAWHDRWGRWHPGYPPRVIVGPPAPIYRPYYAAPYARWVPPHYNRWGRFIPGHYI